MSERRDDPQLSLFGPPAMDAVAAVPVILDDDGAARRFAVDPGNNVVLEASAGTGKTTVLVQRYINLLKAGVEPANILAITFTRKAATEMRERIVRDLRGAAALSEFDKARWVALRDRLGEISISTIDAFCLSLLREFPLEADLDPGFDLADETEVPRFVEEALDASMRIFARLSETDEDVALVLAQLGSTRTRAGLTTLLQRRLVAEGALDRFLARGPRDLRADDVCRRAAESLRGALSSAPGGLQRLLETGPSGHPRYQLFLREMQRLATIDRAGPAAIRALMDRVALHFLTQDGQPRKATGSIPPYNAGHYPSPQASKEHRDAMAIVGTEVERVVRAFARDLNVILARGIRRMFAIALSQYRRTLAARAALDFSDVLERALNLLRRMDEFSQSRFRLESRYHHVLVDEFQDTSRAQWELVSLLIQSWGQGQGLASNPSIFIVGDRKQSIYRFRDAEVAVLQDAGRHIDALRPEGTARRSIARSFRAVPELLGFVNEVCADMSSAAVRADDFTYLETDRFPTAAGDAPPSRAALGIAVSDDAGVCARAVAGEIARLLREDTVRDRKTGVARSARPGDIAILFRSRTSHREFEHELAALGIPTYVYKGLGFFDAEEIKDAMALLRYLAQPRSDLRAAAFLRSAFVRLSDPAIAMLAPRLADAIIGERPALSERSESKGQLPDEDQRVLEFLRGHVPQWLALVDRIPPADLFEQILPQAAYAFELRGRRHQQAWENLKKMRGLVRRVQNRGYATLTRIADHIDALTAGDESNAVLEALDAVNLMTVHASKGLEFPIVFIVNIGRGAGGIPPPVRVVVASGDGDESVSVSPFVSDTDALEREREQHETRRLLYVAMTRARDRLYLSSTLKDGALVAGKGALAEVLPDSLKALFAAAAVATDGSVTWTSAKGRAFAWRVVAAEHREAGLTTSAEAPPLLLRMQKSAAPSVAISVSEWLAREKGAIAAARALEPQPALVGSLVHRMLQSRVRASDDAAVAARAVLRAEERAALGDVDAVIASAADAWIRLRRRDDVAELLSSPTVLTELPFSMRLASDDGPVTVRGTIDCVVIGEDGTVTVVEFKTGGRHPSHQSQLDLYVRAARSIFPSAPVSGRLIYNSVEHPQL